MNPSIVNFVYIVASVLFILGIKMLGKAETARKGNAISAVGMLIAVVVTLFDRQILDFADAYSWAILGGSLALGVIIGAFVAKKVKMTSMPEMVALLNGFGGLASLLVGWADYYFKAVANSAAVDTFTKIATVAAVVIGGITFTGSVYAWGKLSGKISGRAKVYAGQKLVNGFVALVTLVAAISFSAWPDSNIAY